MNEGDDTGTFNDWVITKVERRVKNNVESYVATYHSKAAETYDFKKAQDITFYIRSLGSTEDQVYQISYKINNSKEWVFFDKAEFDMQK